VELQAIDEIDDVKMLEGGESEEPIIVPLKNTL
jgi:hypothetical protein